MPLLQAWLALPCCECAGAGFCARYANETRALFDLRLLLVPKVILTFQGLRFVRCPTHEHKNLQAFGSNTDRPRKRRDVLLHSVEPIDEEIDCERGDGCRARKWLASCYWCDVRLSCYSSFFSSSCASAVAQSRHHGSSAWWCLRKSTN